MKSFPLALNSHVPSLDPPHSPFESQRETSDRMFVPITHLLNPPYNINARISALEATSFSRQRLTVISNIFGDMCPAVHQGQGGHLSFNLKFLTRLLALKDLLLTHGNQAHSMRPICNIMYC